MAVRSAVVHLFKIAVSLPTVIAITPTNAVPSSVLLLSIEMTAESQTTVQSPGKTVYISNLDNAVTDDDLRDHFKKYDGILTCNVVRDKVSQQSKEFGFIKFDDKDVADKAVAEMHETTLKDRRIRVEISKRGGPRKQTPGRYLGPQNPRDERDGKQRFFKKRLRQTIRT